MKHIHSVKLYPFKETCSFKEHIFVQVQGHMFIQENYIYWTLLHSRNSRNVYSKIVPSYFVIIISFTITISCIKYSYNFFRLKDEEIVDMIEGSVIIITVRACSFCYHPTCEELPPEALPASDTISSPKSDIPASELFISKGTIEHFSNCQFLLKIYHFSFFSEVAFHRQNLLIPKRSPLRFTR